MKQAWFEFYPLKKPTCSQSLTALVCLACCIGGKGWILRLETAVLREKLLCSENGVGQTDDLLGCGQSVPLRTWREHQAHKSDVLREKDPSWPGNHGLKPSVRSLDRFFLELWLCEPC